MVQKFEIEITQFSTIHKLPDSWKKRDLIRILELADFDTDESSSEKDLYEYISMAFDDMELEESAELVLKYLLGDKLNSNQITEIAHEMIEENLWEEYGDMSLHEELFKVASFMYHAYNGKFPHPDAAEVTLKINALNHDAEIALKNIDEKLIARLMSKGMTEHAVIYRLFHTNIEGGDWKEAKDIIWQYSVVNREQKTAEIELTTAIYWVKELKSIDSYKTEIIIK